MHIIALPETSPRYEVLSPLAAPRRGVELQSDDLSGRAVRQLVGV